MTAHLMGEPDLAALAECDRLLVARALAKDPHRRFPSCLHFVQALVFGADPAPDAANYPAPRFPPTPVAAEPAAPPRSSSVSNRR